MKIIAIGDTHGRDDWRNISIQNECDKLVFIGDYFDTHEDISPKQQINNFKDIIKFKESSPDEIILLFGNHDFHYMRGIDDRYSGYQPLFEKDIQELIHSALDSKLLQMCFVSDNFIFTHAGITQTWCADNEINMSSIEKSINDLFIYTPNAFKFTPGDYRSPYGDEICQTPIWVRPDSLLRDKIEGFTQVVGHTVQRKIPLGDAIGVWFVDALGTSGEYLDITNGVVEILTTQEIVE